MLGVLRVPCRPSAPDACASPSANTLSGTGQLRQATLPSALSARSKNSMRPSATTCALSGIARGAPPAPAHSDTAATRQHPSRLTGGPIRPSKREQLVQRGIALLEGAQQILDHLLLLFARP